MTEASFRTEPCTSYTKTSDADNKHYNIPLVMWFRNRMGSHPSTLLAFTPDLGHRHFSSGIPTMGVNIFLTERIPSGQKKAI